MLCRYAEYSTARRNACRICERVFVCMHCFTAGVSAVAWPLNSRPEPVTVRGSIEFENLCRKLVLGTLLTVANITLAVDGRSGYIIRMGRCTLYRKSRSLSSVAEIYTNSTHTHKCQWKNGSAINLNCGHRNLLCTAHTEISPCSCNFRDICTAFLVYIVRLISGR